MEAIECRQVRREIDYGASLAQATSVDGDEMLSKLEHQLAAKPSQRIVEEGAKVGAVELSDLLILQAAMSENVRKRWFIGSDLTERVDTP